MQNKDSQKNEGKERILNEDSLSERIIKRLVDADKWVLLLIVVISSEILAAIMSVILKGGVTYDYLITVGVVSLIVGGAIIYFLLEIKEPRTFNILLQQEIFERKQAEDSLEIAHEFLQRAYEDLISLDVLKSNLISNVTHELRTPLFIAKGALELAMDEEDEEKMIELLVMAEEALTRQNLIVDDLMEASHLVAKKREPELEDVDIRDAISNLTGQIKYTLSQNKIKLDVRIDENLPKVRANQKQLAHVMRNLINNSIKFTKKGGKISIEARIEGEFVEVSIRDTGVGIPKNNLADVFDKFFQADTSTERAYGGTGMGLAVVKEIIKAHGGRVGVESEQGIGSRFYFTLLIAKEE